MTEFKDIAYPIRLGANNDLQLCDGYDANVEQSLRFILDNSPKTIAGFPTLGIPLEPFADRDYVLLLEDMIRYDLLQMESRLALIDHVIISLDSSGNCQVDFDYYTKGGSQGHFSTKYYRTVDDV